MDLQTRDNNPITPYHSNFNDRLDAKYLDIPDKDQSWYATIVRSITSFIGSILSPRQVIVVLRLLKAVTFCLLCLTIVANIIFVFMVEINTSDVTDIKLGGTRDHVLRLYAIGLSAMAILIELDVTLTNRWLPGFKGFIPRSLLLYFISTLTATPPIIRYDHQQYVAHKKKYGYYNYNYADDDNKKQKNYYSSSQSWISEEVPGSAVVFQNSMAFFLFVTACVYGVLGLLCLDRFTSRAFLSNDDPVSATAIPGSRGDEVSYDEEESSNTGSYSQYEGSSYK